MDSKYPKMSPEKYAEMIIEAKKRRDESQGCAVPEPVGKWLESNGIDTDTLLRLKPLLRKYDSLTDEQKARIQELRDFEPNPGKATLTQVGETQTFLDGNNRGLPIYKEDVDLIKKSGPLAKRLVEMNKTGEVNTYDKNTETLRTLRDTIDEVYPGDLNTGPDTTENIQEIGDNYPGSGDWKEWRAEHEDVLGMKEEDIRDSGDVMFGTNPSANSITRKVKELLLKSQGIKKNEDEETPDVMWYFDPKSERFKPAIECETEGLQGNDEPYPTTEEMKRYIDEQCNKNVSQDEDKKDPGEYYRYSNILKRMDETHTRKNNDYGDAAYQGYKELGDAYYIVQLHNKLSRLKSLTISNKTQMVKDESIDDTLLDLANYAVMYLESRHRDD